MHAAPPARHHPTRGASGSWWQSNFPKETRARQRPNPTLKGWTAVLEVAPAPGAKSLGTLTTHNQNQPKHLPEHGHRAVNRSGAAMPEF